MIVYGDPQYDAELEGLVDQLRARAAQTSAAPDAVRTLLVLAGQVEQAALDAGVAEPIAAALHAATAHAATALYHIWADGGAAPQVAPTLVALRDALAPFAARWKTPCTVKLPEGFAFYALYPEQYCAAAQRWLTDHAAVHDRTAVVVGIRSIGTTLAAVVAATLRAGGWQVHSLTVRPTGHPFAREAAIPPTQVGGAAWGLVVDEGPGLSGSSLAAAGMALAQAGLPPARISVFPGHGSAPGPAASAAVRAWWDATRRYVTPPAELRLAGRILPEALAAGVTELLGGADPVVQVEDGSGGLWRHWLYPDPAAWPAVCAPFERAKYRCTTAGGRRVLCKFAGFVQGSDRRGSTAEAAAAVLAERAAGGWNPAPLGVVEGFLVLPWIDGAPLTPAAAHPALLAHLGRYLAASAGPPLAPAAQAAALDRVQEMVYWNTWEALGEDAATTSRGWRERAQGGATDAAPLRCYGDSHLAPHEWLRRPTGGLVKVDGAGHAWDHTIVGPQPLAWAVAGACVEWGVAGATAAPLLAAYHDAGGDPLPPAVLAAYRQAYAAFRLGQCALCAPLAPDPAEGARLRHAQARYQDVVTRNEQ